MEHDIELKDDPDECRNPYDSRKRPHYFRWVYDPSTQQTSMTSVQCGTCGVVRELRRGMEPGVPKVE